MGKAKAKLGKKIKQAKKALLVSLIAAAALAAVILYAGGSGFRWFGSKGEEAGSAVKKESNRLGRKADDLREDMKDAAKEVKRDLVDKVTGKD